MTKLQRELTDNLETPFRMVYDRLDMMGCYGLQHSDTYWKGLINNTYTLESLVPYFQGNANPLVRKGLDLLKSKTPARWSTPKTYRDLFLEKAGVGNDPEQLGIHLLCLDKVEAIAIRNFVQGTVHGNPDTIAKQTIFRYIQSAAQPGLTILLSCSQSDLIKMLNDTTLNPTKGPSAGYYYLGFDKNIHYVNNIVVMPTGESYSAELDALEPIQFTEQNTTNSYLQKVDATFQVAIQTILKKGAVYFTTKNILDKFNILVAHIETAPYRISKKQTILPKEVGLFKVEDGTVYTPEAFAESVKTQGNPPLSTNTAIRSILDEHVELRNAPPNVKESIYKKRYDAYLESKQDEIAAIPRILEYVDLVTVRDTWKKKLEFLDYLIEFPEGKEIVANWVRSTTKNGFTYNNNSYSNSSNYEENNLNVNAI
jgi:hypothetical protein